MSRFNLPELPYSYDALEPHIDAITMEIHHKKHHQTYVDNLNKAIDNTALYNELSLVKILQKVARDEDDDKKRQLLIRNNGGGHYNHSFFWLTMGPSSNNSASDIEEGLLDQIQMCYGSIDGLKTKFVKEAAALFGSGFVWLCYDTSVNQLTFILAKNQDNPSMYSECHIPILALDVWEHAYYLKYQNSRKDYVEAWFNVINWKMVSNFYLNYVLKGIMVEFKDDGTL